MKLKELDNKWFFSNVPAPVKFIQIYIKGDMLVLIPFLIFLAIIGLINFRFMIIIAAVFFTIRQLGEMFYWIMRQFFNTPNNHRPYDFGLINLSNKAIYIIYQLFALVGTTLGISFLIYLLRIT